MTFTFDSIFSSIVVLVGVLLTSHVFLYIFRAQKPTGCQSIPGPSLNFVNRLIMFIQIHFFYTVPEFADYWCQRYGDTVGVWMNGGYTIITCDANLTQEFLSGTNSTNFISRMGNDDGLKAIGMFQKGIIWNNNVPRWIIQKRAFQNGLTSEVRQKAFVVATESTRKEILFIKETARNNNVPTVDLLNSVRHITLDVTLDVALGINLDREKSQYLIDCIVGYFKAWEFFLLKPSYIWPLFPLRLIHHKKQVSKLQEEIRRLTSTLNPNSTPFLNNLYSDNAPLTNEEIHQCILEMVLAGTDTSSVSLYYTILFLIENKDIQNKLLDSSDESFMEAVLRESMRLMPVGPVIIRKALADCNMSEMNIKAGTNIVMNLARQNRHPKWFDDPLNFIPQRFQENKGLAECSAPMGLGPKSCVGQHLAMVEMKAILPELLAGFTYIKMKGSKPIMETETKWDVAQQPTTNEILTVFPRKKIILVGAHSVGKTTLARLIGSRTNAVLIGETARTVMKELNIDVKLIETDPQKSLELQAGIIKFQCKREEEIKNEFTVIDRCAVDALVYAKTFCKEQWSGLLELSETKKCMERYKNDDKYIIFLIEPHMNCLKNDGIRMMPTDFDDWKAFSEKYKTIMNEFGIKYHVLEDLDLDLRFSKVFQTIFEV